MCASLAGRSLVDSHVVVSRCSKRSLSMLQQSLKWLPATVKLRCDMLKECSSAYSVQMKSYVFSFKITRLDNVIKISGGLYVMW